MIALAFAGQGTQHRGMGATLFERYPHLVREADVVLGYSITDLCSSGDARLNETQYTQPAIFVVDALAWHDFRDRTGLTPDRVLGHSVGEFAALYAAKVFDFKTGLEIVQQRAELMAKHGGPGTMAALIGPRPVAVELIGTITDLYLANENTPTQVVAAGSRDAVAALETAVRKEPRLTFLPLAVSGAFHCPMMAKAKEAFAVCLARYRLAAPEIPVVSNVTAELHRADTLGSTLAEHMVRPVRWRESICRLLAEGPMLFQDLGPGRTVASLVREIIAQGEIEEQMQGVA